MIIIYDIQITIVMLCYLINKKRLVIEISRYTENISLISHRYRFSFPIKFNEINMFLKVTINFNDNSYNNFTHQQTFKMKIICTDNFHIVMFTYNYV